MKSVQLSQHSATHFRDADLLSFGSVAENLPRSANGKKIHISTIHRWHNKGVKGIRLEAVRIGGRRYTTLENVEKFCKQLSEIDGQPCMPVNCTGRATEVRRGLKQAGLLT